jgi:hypothetical protein
MRPLSAIDTVQLQLPVPNRSQPVSTSYHSLLHPRVNSTATRPAIAGRQEARLLAEAARVLPSGTNLRGALSLQPRLRSPASSARSHSAAARSNTQAPCTTRSPQRTGNSTRFSSADYPLAARRTSPVVVRAAPRNLPYTIRPFSGPPSTSRRPHQPANATPTPHHQCQPHALHARAATSIYLLVSTSEHPSKSKSKSKSHYD